MKMSSRLTKGVVVLVCVSFALVCPAQERPECPNRFDMLLAVGYNRPVVMKVRQQSLWGVFV